MRLYHLIFLLLVTLTLTFPKCISASPPDMYCGEHNCYEILGVESSATQQNIKSAYRKLSLKYHPDKNSDPEAVDLFRQVATAYEILSDETSRAAYDDALAHPERYMYNQYQYYRHRYRHNHIAAWKVITTFIAAICVFDYFQRWSRYAYFRTRIADHPVIRTRMRARAKANLEAEKEAAGVKKNKIKITEAEIEAEMAKDDVSNYAEISSRDGSRPTLRDLVLIALPLYLIRNIYWYFRWFILFTIMKKPYGWEERSYLTAQKLECDWNRWLQFPEETRNPIIEQDIWFSARNFAEFKREQINKNRKGW